MKEMTERKAENQQ